MGRRRTDHAVAVFLMPMRTGIAAGFPAGYFPKTLQNTTAREVLNEYLAALPFVLGAEMTSLRIPRFLTACSGADWDPDTLGEIAWSPGFSRSGPPEGGTPCEGSEVARETKKASLLQRVFACGGGWCLSRCDRQVPPNPLNEWQCASRYLRLKRMKVGGGRPFWVSSAGIAIHWFGDSGCFSESFPQFFGVP